MNSTPEVVRAEMDYRLERARRDMRNGTLAHLRAARSSNPTWWRRLRVQHHQPDDAA